MLAGMTQLHTYTYVPNVYSLWGGMKLFITFNLNLPLL